MWGRVGLWIYGVGVLLRLRVADVGGVGAKGFRFVLGFMGTPNHDPLHQTTYQKLRNEPYFFLKW